MRRVNTFIGSPVERVEDLRFLRGRGQYVDDLARPGQWHAAIVRSPVAHGRLRVGRCRRRACDAGRACRYHRKRPRRGRCRPFRSGGPRRRILPYAQPVMADEVVRYVGEPVAMVLADSAGTGRGRRAGGRVDIEHLPAVADRRASARGEVLLIAGTASNCASVFTANAGDVDAAFRNAAYTRREQFRVQRMTAMTMETRGLLAEWDAAAGRLTVSGAAKLPFFNRRAMAAMMGLPEDGGRLHRIRRRRRLWRARRVLSGGFPGRLRGAQIRPAGEMGRGPARAFHGDRAIRARPNATSRSRSTRTAPCSACAATSGSTSAPMCGRTA